MGQYWNGLQPFRELFKRNSIDATPNAFKALSVALMPPKSHGRRVSLLDGLPAHEKRTAG